MSLRALTVEGPPAAAGTAVVWKVRTAGHGVPLALKTLPPERAADGGRRSILENELQALAPAATPRRGPPARRGRRGGGGGASGTGAGPGDPLDADGRGSTAVPVGRAAAGCRWGLLRPVFEDVLAALAHLHARGLVHRDLSPSNVLWSLAGPTLQAHRSGPRPAGRCGPVPSRAGTPGFVAPEVVTGGPVDGRADLFSLGRVAAGLTQDVGLVGCPVASWRGGGRPSAPRPGPPALGRGDGPRAAGRHAAAPPCAMCSPPGRRRRRRPRSEGSPRIRPRPRPEPRPRPPGHDGGRRRSGPV